jgi:predicted MFS family arabinose efflux permease
MLGPLMFGHIFDWLGVNAVFMLGTFISVATLILFYVNHMANREQENYSESAAASMPQSG